MVPSRRLTRPLNLGAARFVSAPLSLARFGILPHEAAQVSGKPLGGLRIDGNCKARCGNTIARNWVAELPNRRVIRFDGVVDSPTQIILIEVKILTSPDTLPGEVFINTSENVIALRQHFKRPVIAVIALVAPEET